MKLRYKATHEECACFGFNVHAISEVLVGDDSVYIKDLQVYLENAKPPGWKDLSQAFQDRDVIPNNYNTHFREPNSEAERQQGFYD